MSLLQSLKGSASQQKRITIGGGSTTTVNKLLPKTDLSHSENKRVFVGTPIGVSSLSQNRVPITIQGNLKQRKTIVAIDKSSTYNHQEAPGDLEESHLAPSSTVKSRTVAH